VVLDHGYCLSLYLDDPNGMHLEFTADSDAADPASAVFANARGELVRLPAGDHTPNNPLRHG
jgi:glyoxylase I family protein